jgi:hypothetical protein
MLEFAEGLTNRADGEDDRALVPVFTEHPANQLPPATPASGLTTARLSPVLIRQRVASFSRHWERGLTV